MKDRVKRIFDNLEEDVDAIYIRNSTEPIVDKTFFYVTGIRSGLFESSTAVLYPDKEMEVIVPPLEETSARGYGLNLSVVPRRAEVSEHLKEKFKGCKRIGVNSPEVSYAAIKDLEKAMPKAKLVDVSKAVMAARLVKDEEEIKAIRKACRVVARVAKEIPDFLEEGIKEVEMAAEINHRMQKYGALEASFTTISSFGKNSAEPHYTSGNKKLKKGQFALFDYGARVGRYVSDITRTYACGKPSAKMQGTTGRTCTPLSRSTSTGPGSKTASSTRPVTASDSRCTTVVWCTPSSTSPWRTGWSSPWNLAYTFLAMAASGSRTTW